jgi:hypothetical protein
MLSVKDDVILKHIFIHINLCSDRPTYFMYLFNHPKFIRDEYIAENAYEIFKEHHYDNFKHIVPLMTSRNRDSLYVDLKKIINIHNRLLRDYTSRLLLVYEEVCRISVEEDQKKREIKKINKLLTYALIISIRLNDEARVVELCKHFNSGKNSVYRYEKDNLLLSIKKCTNFTIFSKVFNILNDVCNLKPEGDPEYRECDVEWSDYCSLFVKMCKKLKHNKCLLESFSTNKKKTKKHDEEDEKTSKQFVV